MSASLAFAGRRPGKPDARPEATAGRILVDRLAVLSPVPYRWLCAAVWLVIGRLRPESRIRRAALLRACRRAYAAFNRGDLPVFLSMFHHDVLYDIARVRDWPEPGDATGLSGIREMVRNWHSSWDFSFALHELHDLGGNRCLLLGEFTMTGAGSGVPLDHVRWAQIGTIRRGRWIHVENFTDALHGAAKRRRLCAACPDWE